MDFYFVIDKFIEKNLDTYHLEKNLKFSKNINVELVEQLKINIKDIFIEVLRTEYNSFKNIYSYKPSKYTLKKFLEAITRDEYIKEFKINFPALIYKLNKKVLNFIDYSNEIYLNLEKHRKYVPFKNIEKLDLFLGDPHNNNKSVAKVLLDGKTYYYKPRSSKLDIKFQKFISNYIAGYDFNIYNYETFSLHEKIDNNPFLENLDECEEFYFNIGVISSVFYFLNATDMHYENLIVNKTIPFFIDLETISDLTRYENKNFDEGLLSLYGDSVFHSLIYPFNMHEKFLNVSALTGGAEEVLDFHYKVNSYSLNEYGEIEVKKVNPALEKQKNNIIYNGNTQVPIEYLDQIKQGFAYFSDLVLSNKKYYIKELINIIKNEPIRQIIKPTHIYMQYLITSNEPYYFLGEMEQQELFSNIISNHKKLSKDEIQQLTRGDIPYYYTYSHSMDLYTITNKEVVEKAYFTKSIEELIENKIESFDYDTKTSELINIENSLTSYYLNDNKNTHHVSKSLYKNIDFLEYRHIKRSNYSVLLPSLVGNNVKLMPIGPSIFDYGGNLILSLFNNPTVQKTSNLKHMLSTMLKWKSIPFNSLDGFSGLGGYLYILNNAYSITHDKWFQKKINEAIKEIIYNNSISFKNIDYFTGLSGFLTIFYGTYENIDDLMKEDFYKFSLKLNKKLIGCIESIDESPTKIGLSHGYSGILIALSKFDKTFGVKENSYIIKKVLSKEDSYYDENYNNYPDLRNNCYSQYYLCYGIIGILLARIELYENNALSGMREDIKQKSDRLIQKFLNNPLELDYSYCVCHGYGSLLELFIELHNYGFISNDVFYLLVKKLKGKMKETSKNGLGNNIPYNSFLLGQGGVEYIDFRLKYNIPSIFRGKCLKRSE
ncbi:type 2 lanthipeptide synthetase LanM [Staphylococcus pseudintermedius]|uniref:type 2 lanthipeptide synthetase LanM n=1 Tax=Staphylococcus pseudintermedius TaxID=283734 RepID=UPI002ED987B5